MSVLEELAAQTRLREMRDLQFRREMDDWRLRAAVEESARAMRMTQPGRFCDYCWGAGFDALALCEACAEQYVIDRVNLRWCLLLIERENALEAA